MGHGKILLVDDDIEFTRLVADLLRPYDYNVEVSHTGEDALAKLRSHPDIILLDMLLPDMKGSEVCRRIKSDQGACDTPVILLTAQGETQDKIKGLHNGADDYIVKPFDSGEFLARVEAVLRRSRITQRRQEYSEEMVSELKRIIEQGLITPFFQPIFSLKTFELLGAEALSHPPEDSFLSNPETFFQIAVTSSMYFELERLCWNKAISRWQAFSSPALLFLNCDPSFIESGELSRYIQLQETSRFHNVVLEVTERTAVKNYDVFLEKVNEGRRFGLRIAIDDVGGGFASLDMVARVKPDFVKIDMFLISSIKNELLKENIIKAISTMCQESKIMTIAEGIETEAELKKVVELGIDAGQGYLLGKPAMDIKADCPLRG